MKSCTDNYGNRYLRVLDVFEDFVDISMSDNDLYIDCLSSGSDGQVVGSPSPIILDKTSAAELVKVLTYYIEHGKLYEEETEAAR